MKQASNDWRAIFIIAAVWLLMAALIGLGGDFPLNDDWAYAHSARRLLHTGELRILDWAAPSLIAHVAFGAMLLRLFGESNVVLRGGTIGLGLVTLLLTYTLSRRAGLSSRRALLAALALGLSPWFVNLSFTFMSDVPWLCVMLLALWVGTSALRPAAAPRVGRLVLVGVLLGVAALIRQFAVVTLPAFIIVAAVDARRRLRGSAAVRKESLRSALLVTLPLVAIYGCYQYWYSRIHGPTMANRETWRQMRDVDLLTVLRHTLAIAYYFGLWLLPLALSLRSPLRAPRTHRPAIVTAIALTLFALGEAIRALYSLPRVWGPSATIKPLMPYLGNIFYLVGLGPPTLYPTYSGHVPWVHTNNLIGVLLTIASLLGAVLAMGLVVPAAQALYATLCGPANQQDTDSEKALASEARLLIAVAGVFYLGWHLCTGPFLFDRYILPLLPLAWILGLSVATERLRRWPIVVVFTLSGLFSVAGTREYLSWNQARATAVNDLLAAGIPSSQIDAGFEWNGTWRFEQYVREHGTIRHPDQSWWSVNLPYVLTFEPHRGCETVRRYPFWTWPGGGEPSLLVLHCPPGQPLE